MQVVVIGILFLSNLFGHPRDLSRFMQYLEMGIFQIGFFLVVTASQFWKFTTLLELVAIYLGVWYRFTFRQFPSG